MNEAQARKQGYGGGQSSDLEAYGPQGLLRSLRASSAGVVVMVSGYGLYVPHFGTSPSVVDSRSFARPTAPPVRPSTGPTTMPTDVRTLLALSIADQARELLASLALNKTQLADVLRVSRPTLYEWLDGIEPNPSNAERLSKILRLLATAGVTSSNPLNARLVRQAVNEGASSLLEVLQAATLDESLVVALVREAKGIEQQGEARRAARHERLRHLGFDEPTDEQRREQLARNIATSAWPKI